MGLENRALKRAMRVPVGGKLTTAKPPHNDTNFSLFF